MPRPALSPPPRWFHGSLPAARILLVFSIGGAAYLAWNSFSGGGIAGCGPQGGCAAVLSSRWAYWFDLPVSVPALVVYLAALVASFDLSAGLVRRRPAQGIAVVALAGCVLGAATWFICIQHFVLHRWCRICLLTHGCAATASLLMAYGLRPPKRASYSGVALASLGLVGLIGGQFAPQTARYAFARLPRWSDSPGTSGIALYNGRFGLDPNHLPRLGSPSARQFVIETFDYTCGHCRTMHPYLKEALSRLGGDTAVIVLPAPLDSECNPAVRETALPNFGACDLARLALAVFSAKPSAFSAFDDYLFSGDEPPTYRTAHAKAESLVGGAALKDALESSWISRQLEEDVALYITTGRSLRNAQLPQLIFLDAATAGEIDDPAALEDLIRSHKPLRSSG